jgi:hypothetical protein
MQSLKVPKPSNQDTSVKTPVSTGTTDCSDNKVHCSVFDEHNKSVFTPLAASSSISLLLRQKYANSGAPSSRSKEFQVKITSDSSV